MRHHVALCGARQFGATLAAALLLSSTATVWAQQGPIPPYLQQQPYAQPGYQPAPGIPAAQASNYPMAPYGGYPVAPQPGYSVGQPYVQPGAPMGAPPIQTAPAPAAPTWVASNAPTAPQRPANFTSTQSYLQDYQDTPGAQYGPAAQYAPGGLYGPSLIVPPGGEEPIIPLPQSTADYMLPAVGPHEYPDYAPYGFFEPRPFQDAPGVPEFTPITPAPPTTPEERAKFVTRGLAPGSFLVPGTDTSFRIRGFVRLGGMQDLDPIGSRDDFVTNTIPVPQTEGENFNFSARYSRFGIDTWTPTTFNDWNVHTFVEGDFFNGPAQAVGGGGNPFRLRFAFFDFGYFRFGQQNTVFMDSNAFPSTADFAGPRGLANLRRAMARMTLPIGERWYWALGIEQPFSDITTNGLGTNVQDVPDLATHLRFETDYGHVQLSGLVRAIEYQPTGSDDVTSRTGSGFSASTVFHPWAMCMGCDPVHTENPSGWVRSRILLQYTVGQGIGRYIQDTAGLGLDGQVDPITGAFDTVGVQGWSASYEQWFNEHWLSNLTYSQVSVDSAAGQPGATYDGANYLAVSLWWIPVPRMSIAIEYLYGERLNLDDQSANANRIQTLFQYNF